MQAQIDGQRALGNWDEVLKSVQTYKKLLEAAQYSRAHPTQALAAAYIASVKAEVALKKKRGSIDDARRYIHTALEADPTYPVRRLRAARFISCLKYMYVCMLGCSCVVG